MLASAIGTKASYDEKMRLAASLRQPHLHVASRRILDRLQLPVAGLPSGHLRFVGGKYPALPVGPPGARHLGGALEPALRVGRKFRADPVAIFPALGRIDDAGDVTRRRQDEPLRAAQQLGAAIGRFPRRDMILPRREKVSRRLDRSRGRSERRPARCRSASPTGSADTSSAGRSCASSPACGWNRHSSTAGRTGTDRCPSGSC